MNITQQPLSLSLSGNLKKFVIGGSAGEAITFKLRKGATTIMEQSLIIPSSGSISIDVKEAVEYQLRYILTDTGVAYEQTGIVADFSALINATTVNFRCIRGGVANLEDTPTNFLTSNFLTWQPIQKKVTYYSPEFLTYYAVVAGYVKLKGYYLDGTTELYPPKTVTLKTLTSGKCYTMPLQYANVITLLANGEKYPSHYEVWAENNSGTRLTYIQRYVADNARSEQEQWLLFENSLGGLDTVRAYGAVALEGDHTHNLSESDDVASEYRVDTERLFEKNTGSLDNYERRWLLDFFPSLHKYIYADATIRAIVVTESDVKYDEGSLPSSYSFTYKYASATALLNITRPAALPTDLVITVPDFGSFSLPPRLAEFPSLALTEGALIALQSPYSEEWGTTTIGSILQYIGEHLTDAGGSGGVGHTHNNLTMLQLLSTLDGYLKYNGVKILAGGADVAGDFATGGAGTTKYARKDVAQSIAEVYTFTKGIVSTLLSVFNAGIQIGTALLTDVLGVLTIDKPLNVAGDITSTTGDVKGEDIRATDALKLGPSAEAKMEWNATYGRVDLNKGLKQIGNSRVVGDHAVAGTSTTGSLEVIDTSTLWEVILEYMLHSPSFVNGFTGNGMKLWEEGGQWKMELDQLTVRRIFYAYEMIIQTVRHINGGLVVSQGNGKIKSVTSDATYYTITVEGAIQFVADDNIYHQKFSNGTSLKYYAAKVVSVNTTTNSFTALKTDFAGVVPAEGDEIVQWGNATNTARQSLIYISAMEDGKPRISVKKGVTSIGTGETKTVMGTLDGIIDPIMGALSGEGFFSDNFYGKGVFILKSTGENVETLISATAEGLSTTVSALNAYKASSRNHLRNTAFQEAINVANVSASNVTIGRVTTGNRIAKCNMMSMRQDTAANATLSATGGYVNFIPLNNKSCTPATFSMWVKSLYDCTLLVRVYPTSNAVQSFSVLANVWTKIVVSVPNQLGNIRFGWDSAPVDSADLKLISEPILAESTKEQNWQPAPEDNLSIGELAATYTTITQTASQIAAAVADADGILASISLNASGTVKIEGSLVELTGTSSSSGKVVVDINGILHAIDGFFSGTVEADTGIFGAFQLQGKQLLGTIPSGTKFIESTKVTTEYLNRVGSTWYERLSYGDAAFTILNPTIGVQLTRTVNFHKFKVVDASAESPSPIYILGVFSDAWASIPAQTFPVGTLASGKVTGALVYNSTNIASFEYTLYLYKDGSNTPLSTTSFPKLNDLNGFNITENGEYSAQLIIKITPVYTPGVGGHTIVLDFMTQTDVMEDGATNCGIMHRGDDHYRTTIARNGIRVWAGANYFLHYSDKDGLHFKNGNMTILTDGSDIVLQNGTTYFKVRPTEIRYAINGAASKALT